MKEDPYLEMLVTAVESGHQCDATHKESVHVKEAYRGQDVFDGKVEVFTLRGHPTATLAYAWGWKADSGEVKCVAVLNDPPVTTPLDAVKVAIAGKRFP